MNRLTINLLIELRNRGKYGDTVEGLLSMLRVGGHRSLTQPELEKALRDLADKSLVTTVDAQLGGTKWRITALGESTMKEEGL